MSVQQAILTGEAVDTWEPDALGRAMMETARLERKRAAERDGLMSRPESRQGFAPCRGRSDAGLKAARLITENPALTARELAELSGLGERAARHIMRKAGIAPSVPRSPAGIAARAILAAEPDITAADLARRSGLSIGRARDVWREARGMFPANGAPRSKAGIEAERLAREGRNASEIVAALGVSRQMARRAVQRAQA